MYLEGSSRFLLSAKQLNNDVFLISTNEDFPLSGMDGRERIGYCGSICRQDDRTFLVDINHCHLCDNVIGRFNCGRDNREMVARIAHSVVYHKQGNAEMRLVHVSFPYLNKAPPEIMREGRRTWCPRTLLETGPVSMPIDTTFQERIQHHPNNVKCVSKLPVWNEADEILMLHFQNNRVLATSACNFILYEERKLIAKTAAPQPPPFHRLPPSPLHANKQPILHTGAGGGRPAPPSPKGMPPPPKESSGASAPLPQPQPRPRDIRGQPLKKPGEQVVISPDHAIMQFGRADSHRFILDFKYPMSPLQAFGAAISTFAFDTKKSRKARKEARPAAGAEAEAEAGAGGRDMSSALKSPVGRKILRAGNLTSWNDASPRLKSWTTSNSTNSKEEQNSGYDSDASDSSKASTSSYNSNFSVASHASQDSNASFASNYSNLSYRSNASAHSQYSNASNNAGGQLGSLSSLPSPANKKQPTTVERAAAAAAVNILEQSEDEEV